MRWDRKMITWVYSSTKKQAVRAIKIACSSLGSTLSYGPQPDCRFSILAFFDVWLEEEEEEVATATVEGLEWGDGLTKRITWRGNSPSNIKRGKDVRSDLADKVEKGVAILFRLCDKFRREMDKLSDENVTELHDSSREYQR